MYHIYNSPWSRVVFRGKPDCSLTSPFSNLADIRSILQLKRNLLGKNIMHRISRMQTIQPKVLVDRNTARRNECISRRCSAERSQQQYSPKTL